jgi:YihY family inner membrane protein
VRRADEYQQSRRWLAFPFAVVKKFGDDRAGNLAALIAYYGFFSLFPLLLALFTLTALLLGPDSDLARRIQDSALAQFPVIGEDIRRNIGTISGSGLALVIGLGGALWGGLGVTQAAQTAMNEIWDVPKKVRPAFVESKLRGLLMLVILGSLTILSTILAAFGTAGGSFFPFKLLGLGLSFLVNLCVFLISFRVLTDRNLSWGEVFPGAATACVLWGAAQIAGGYYVNNQVQGASDTYGFFGLVIGLLAWLYLGATITLYSAEVNVVLQHGLWPRSLQQKPPLTPADERTLTRAAKVEEKIPPQRVDVTFEEGAVEGEGGPGRVSPEDRAGLPRGATPVRLKEASTPAILASVARDLRGLVSSEVRLLRQEIREAITARVKAAIALGIAAVVVLFVVLFAGQSLANALDGPLPAWAARAIVGLVFVILGGAAAAFGLRTLRRPKRSPSP